MAQSPERVFRKRVEAGLQQNELARMAGITSATMSRIETGFSSAKPAVLVRIAKALGCEVVDLMPDESAESAA